MSNSKLNINDWAVKSFARHPKILLSPAIAW